MFKNLFKYYYQTCFSRLKCSPSQNMLSNNQVILKNLFKYSHQSILVGCNIPSLNQVLIY